MFNKKYVTSLFVALFIAVVAFGQNVESDILLEEYDTLQTKFITYFQKKDSILALQYATAYLQKAKKDSDTLKIVNGYYFKLILDEKKNKYFHYYDTIIKLSKNFKNQNFPTVAYFDKGIFYHKNQQFKDALDNFLQAIAHNHGSNKEYLEFLLNENIARIKLRIDKNKEALHLIQECWKYAMQNKLKDWNPNEYYSVLYYLSDAYRKTKLIDSARVYTRIGLLEENTSDNGVSFHKFLMLNSVFEIYDEKFTQSETNLLKVVNRFEKGVDKDVLATVYYFLGKNYQLSNKEEQAVINFKKVDSIFKITGDIVPEHTDGYQYIINYYKENENLEQQLEYIQQLFSVDSTLLKNYKYLNEELTNKFDIPKLISSKEEVIEKLKREKQKSRISFSILLGILLLIIGIAIYQYQKRILYQKRFSNLVTRDDQLISNKKLIEIVNTNSIEIPEEIINDVLKKLQIFEKSLEFTDSQLNLGSLANRLGTNSNYLSKLINHYKKEGFSSYIKRLRVQYGFNRLKSEVTFRKYTIKAISQECGFKTAESFSKTFYKIFGIYPSYFIKKLNEMENK